MTFQLFNSKPIVSATLTTTKYLFVKTVFVRSIFALVSATAASTA